MAHKFKIGDKVLVVVKERSANMRSKTGRKIWRRVKELKRKARISGIEPPFHYAVLLVERGSGEGLGWWKASELAHEK